VTKKAKPEVRVLTIRGWLDDLDVLFQDLPEGTVDDFDIEEDPDEDLDPGVPTEVTTTFTLTDLEPTTLIYILRHRFGEDWWQQDRDAIFELLRSIGQTVEEADKDAIRSLQLLYADEAFWTEWEVFNWVTQGLTDGVVDFTNLPVLAMKDMMRSMLVAMTVAQQQKVDVHYSDETVSYIAVTCMEHGQWALPFPLDVAQNRVQQLLRWRGIQDLPLGQVRDLVKESATPTPVDEVSTQAYRFRLLLDFAIQELKEAKVEIDAYRDAVKE
jgi:hypothetical protein